MFDWLEICLLVAAVALPCCAMTPPLRSYRFLFFRSSALLLISAPFARDGNMLGEYLFARTSSRARLPTELFGIAW
jgi:hypothetical protein